MQKKASYQLRLEDTKENINITQYDDESIPEPIDLCFVQDEAMTICRAPGYSQKGKLFNYSYSIVSTLDEIPADITK